MCPYHEVSCNTSLKMSIFGYRFHIQSKKGFLNGFELAVSFSWLEPLLFYFYFLVSEWALPLVPTYNIHCLPFFSSDATVDRDPIPTNLVFILMRSYEHLCFVFWSLPFPYLVRLWNWNIDNIRFYILSSASYLRTL